MPVEQLETIKSGHFARHPLESLFTLYPLGSHSLNLIFEQNMQFFMLSVRPGLSDQTCLYTQLLKFALGVQIHYALLWAFYQC